MPAGVVAEVMQTDSVGGLEDEEALRRRKQFGPNELTERAPRSAVRMAIDQFANTIIVVLLAAAAITIVIGDPRDAVVIAVVVALNGGVGFYQDRGAQRAMAALKRLAGSSAAVIRSGRIRATAASEVVPGDLLRLEVGDVVAADGRLLETVGLRVNEAPLTGESLPVTKMSQPIGGIGTPLSERTSMVYRGTAVVGGRGIAVVTDTGMRTEIGRVAGLLSREAPPTPLQRRLAALGRHVALLAILLCGIVFTVGLIGGQPIQRMLLTAVSLAVAAIPESLPAVVTMALALGAQRMAQQHAVVRKLVAVEGLGSVTVIGTDKTGTLTRGEMQVDRIWTVDGSEFRATGRGYAPDGEVQRIGGTGPWPDAFHGLLRTAILCNDAVLVAPKRPGASWEAVGDPTEAALLALAARAGLSRKAILRQHPRRLEVAFDPQRRRMTTVHGPESKAVVATKGALDSVLPLLRRSPQGESSAPYDEAQRQARRLAAAGYRVLALAGAEATASLRAGEEEKIPLELYGLVAIADPVRDEAPAAVAAARRAGVRTVMITGDHPATAQAVGARLGILPSEGVMTGAELAREAASGSRAHLTDVAIFARTTAEQKLDLVTAWQAEGEIVAMTGDGVNDAPALRRADIGVAMGLTGTEVSKEASDIILADDDFSTIVTAIREGRRIYDNIRRFVRYGLTGGSAEVWVMLAGPFLGMPLPLLPVQILWVNLLTHGLPGLALGVEGAEPDAMDRPPRRPNESILGGGLWKHVAVMGLLTAAVTLGLAHWERSHDGPWQTMLFCALAFLQLGNALAVRSERVSTFRLGIRTNTYLVAAVLGTLLLQLGVVYWGPAEQALHTEPLALTDLLILLAISTTTFWAVETEKFVRTLARRTPRQRVVTGHVPR